MGCKFARAKADARPAQNKLRFSQDYAPDEPRNFHDQYVLNQKISQSNFHQIHLACKVEKEQRRGSLSSLNSLTLLRQSKRPSLDKFKINRSVKIVDLRLKTKQVCKLAHNEVHIWKSLGKHNHCVRLFDVKYEFELCFLIMEMCSTSLLHYLQRLPVVDERTLGESFAQMLLGIEFLHKANVVHRDIKPDNFLVGGESNRTIKICDFTLATRYDTECKLKGESGTPLFMSPEMLLGTGYDMKADVWSFGVIVYALLFGRFPYCVDEKDSAGVKHAIAHAEEPPSYRTSIPISASVLAFVMSILARDPYLRKSAQNALKMTFMYQIIAKCHESHNSYLPSLKPMLLRVKKLRAFSNKDVRDKSEIDDLLNRQQLEVHGISVPGTQQQSIVVQRLGSNQGLEATRKLEKRNSLSDLDQAERGFGPAGSLQSLQSRRCSGMGAALSLDSLNGAGDSDAESEVSV